VDISVGLNGAKVSVDVDAAMSVEDLTGRVREVYPEAGEHFIKLCGGGIILKTGKDIADCIQRGEGICAAFLKNADAMNLEELQAELSLDNNEFQGHLHVLRHYQAKHTAADVAQYLWDNQILLTSTQAQRIFDAAVEKISRTQNPSNFGGNGPRAQLILALHSFCLEPYAIREPQDDCAECLWANMRWADTILSSGRYHLRGELRNIPSSTSSSSPEAQRTDVTRLRSVLNSRRNDVAQPLASMTFLKAYNYSWQSLT